MYLLRDNATWRMLYAAIIFDVWDKGIFVPFLNSFIFFPHDDGVVALVLQENLSYDIL